MAQGRFYLNEADHINKYTYKVRVPAYVLNQPEVYITGELAPIRAPMRADAEQITRLSINRLIELYHAKTPFNILNHIDIVEIFHHLDLYLEVMGPRITAGEPRVLDYCRKVVAFRQWWYRRRFLWALNKNPAWRNAYMGEESEITKILELFPSLGARQQVLDPIQALERPPIRIPEPNEPKPELPPVIEGVPLPPLPSAPPQHHTPQTTVWDPVNGGEVDYYPFT